MSTPGLDKIVIDGISMPVVFETLSARSTIEYTFIRPATDGSPVLVVRNLDPRREEDAEAIRNVFRTAKDKYSSKEAIERALFHYQKDTVRDPSLLGGYSF